MMGLGGRKFTSGWKFFGTLLAAAVPVGGYIYVLYLAKIPENSWLPTVFILAVGTYSCILYTERWWRKFATDKLAAIHRATLWQEAVALDLVYQVHMTPARLAIRCGDQEYHELNWQDLMYIIPHPENCVLVTTLYIYVIPNTALPLPRDAFTTQISVWTKAATTRATDNRNPF